MRSPLFETTPGSWLTSGCLALAPSFLALLSCAGCGLTPIVAPPPSYYQGYSEVRPQYPMPEPPAAAPAAPLLNPPRRREAVATTEQNCPACGGSGKVICPQCRGAGRLLCPNCKGNWKNPSFPNGTCPTCIGWGGWLKCRLCQTGPSDLLNPSTGWIRCSRCGGSGKLVVQTKVSEIDQ